MTLSLNKYISSGLFAMAVAASAPAHAIVSFGIKGGMNMSTVAIDPAVVVPAYGTGYMGGIGIKVGAGIVGFLVDVLYAQRAVKIPAILTLPETTFKTNNLYIPAQINFGLGPILLTAGGFYQMGLGSMSINGVSTTYAANGTESADYGVVAGIGLKLMKFSVEARYNFGLKDMDTDAASTQTSRSIDLLAGYWF